ncbi:MAG TPA: hypothetical protein VIY73_23925, partial [Polyangiaceae bacterium]
FLPGDRRLFIGRSQIPFEAERVRVPPGVRVVEVNLGTHRFEPRPCDVREHATGFDVALMAMGRRRIWLDEGKTIEVLLEAAAPVPRCVPVLLGQPLVDGVSCVPLSPIERTDLFDLGEGIVDIATEPVQRGRVARLLFRADDLDDLDLVDLKVGKDSQFAVAADVPLGLFPDGLDVSCELEAWQALSFRLRNRGAPKKLSIEAEVAPPTRTQE